MLADLETDLETLIKISTFVRRGPQVTALPTRLVNRAAAEVYRRTTFSGC